jgi:nucleotide-binding universal stress UspA family protein
VVTFPAAMRTKGPVEPAAPGRSLRLTHVQRATHSKRTLIVNQAQPAPPVVVGIDGSPAALAAALWAAQEALGTGAALRLVHAISVEDDVCADCHEDPAKVARDWPETEHGLVSLRAASAAVLSTGRPISVETQIMWGNADDVLVAESKHAALVCVGTVGIAPLCHRTLGSTAATVAEQAHSPVAIIRSPHSPTAEPDWIVAVVDDIARHDAVVDRAFQEARLRRAPVLALGIALPDDRGVHYDELERRVTGWRSAHPNLHIHSVAVPTDVTSFLRQHQELCVQLVVLDGHDAEQVPAIVGPHRQNEKTRHQSSVLVVR